MTSNPAESAQPNSPANSSVPTWFWVVGAIALLWNLMGMAAFFLDPGVNSAMMEPTLEMLPEDQREPFKALYETRPMWVTIAFGVAVFGGVAGCIALLARKKVATYIFLLSLLGVVLQNAWVFFKTDILQTSGVATAAMPLMVILIGAGLIFYSLKLTAKGWLT